MERPICSAFVRFSTTFSSALNVWILHELDEEMLVAPAQAGMGPENPDVKAMRLALDHDATFTLTC